MRRFNVSDGNQRKRGRSTTAPTTRGCREVESRKTGRQKIRFFEGTPRGCLDAKHFRPERVDCNEARHGKVRLGQSIHEEIRIYYGGQNAVERVLSRVKR